MKIFNTFVIALAVFASTSALAAGKIQVDCANETLVVTGTLTVSKGGALSGFLTASGSDVPSSVSGNKSYKGIYLFAKAGRFYKAFDYEVIDFMAKAGGNTLYVKSYVTLEGSLSQTAYINAKPTPIQCKFTAE